MSVAESTVMERNTLLLEKRKVLPKEHKGQLVSSAVREAGTVSLILLAGSWYVFCSCKQLNVWVFLRKCWRSGKLQ